MLWRYDLHNLMTIMNYAYQYYLHIVFKWLKSKIFVIRSSDKKYFTLFPLIFMCPFPFTLWNCCVIIKTKLVWFNGILICHNMEFWRLVCVARWQVSTVTIRWPVRVWWRYWGNTRTVWWPYWRPLCTTLSSTGGSWTVCSPLPLIFNILLVSFVNCKFKSTSNGSLI